MKIFLIAIGLWVVANTSQSFFVKGELVYFYTAFLSLSLYLEIKPLKIMYKYLSYFWMCYCFSNTLSDPFVEYLGINDTHYYSVCFITILAGLCYLFSRSYDMPSDKYTMKGIYLVFKKPQNAFDLSISMIFRTASSVSVVIDNDWYGFSKDNSGLYTKKYIHSDRDCLMRVSLDKTRSSSVVNAMLETPWSFTSNCCHFAQKLFSGQEFSPLDSIPCILLRKLEKLKENGTI